MMKNYYKIIQLCSIFIFLFSLNGGAQCISPNAYGNATVNACGSQTINTCTYGGEYNTIQFNITGVFQVGGSGGVGNYLTFTDVSNTVIAFGNSPITVTVNTPGVYRLHLSTSSSCSVDAVCHTTDVQCTGSIPGTPTITTQPTNTTICANANANFIMAATGATSYTWQVNNGTGFTNIINGGVYSGANTPTLNLTNVPGSMNNYLFQCVASNSIGGSVTNAATLTVNNTNISVTGNLQLCQGSSGVLNASGAVTYTWSTGSNSTSIAISPSVNTNYTVTGTSSVSCISSPVIVTVQVVPNPTISATGATVCSYPGIATLTATTNGNMVNWYTTPTSTASIGTGSLFATPVTTTSTVYYAEANSFLNGTLPTTLIGGNGQSGNMFDITALNTIQINGFDMNIQGTTASTVEVWYRPGSFVGFESSNVGWTQVLTTTVTGMGTGSLTPVPGSFSVNVPAGQTYAFYVTTNGGPTVAYTNGTTVGNVYASNSDLQFKEGNGGGYFSVTFTPRIFNGLIRYNKPGCSSPRVPATVGVVNSPSVAAMGFSICAGQTTSVIATGATTYSWNTGASTQAITVSPSVTTTYSVIGTSGICSNMATATVTVNLCTGISETASDISFNLYPNPAGNSIHVIVSNLYADTYFELMDVSGKIILREKLENNTSIINTKFLASGVYIYRIQKNSENLKQGKLIKE